MGLVGLKKKRSSQKINRTYKIAIEFDGTIVEDCYPTIGDEKLFAFNCLRALQEKGDQLILWTNREGPELNAAIEFCRSEGVHFYAINRNYPEEQTGQPGYSRKVNADYFIDHRNIGGIPDWSEIYQRIHSSHK